MKNILIIAAHPDDEVLGCGGTMAKLSNEGHRVYTLILGEGVTSRDTRRDRNIRKSDLIKLKKQAARANKILGVTKTFLFDFPDNRFDTIALLDIVKTLESVKGDIKPDTIFTHFKGDLNIDHRITFEAVMTAFRPIKGESVKEIYSFETPSSTEWAFGQINTVFNPNVFIEIGGLIGKKQKALEAYQNEVCAFPHPRSIESMTVIATRWGTVMGEKSVEAFELIRMIS